MKKGLMFLLLFVSFQASSQVKSLVSGPMIGHTDFRSSVIWIETTVATGWSVKYTTGIQTKSITAPAVSTANDHYILKFFLTGLNPGTSYQFDLLSKNVKINSGTFTTQTLWQYRNPAPDFSFLTGSCSYFNEPIYDRPGRPYGRDSSIFEPMAKEKSSFMLWLGDNWYTREVDYFSESGLHYRASRDRSLKILQPFLKSMPQYAIWDDHDYGWNDSDKSYPLKETSREVFKKFWCNPSYGANDQGIYSKFTWNDLDVFLLDDRWWRNNDNMMDSVNGQPNTGKKMYGDQQMEWLKNALLQSQGNSNISFRIIATGSQVLNPMSPWDCLRHFPTEYMELMKFISDNKINGIVFITGDRHHSEVIKMDRPGSYPLFDITSSPLTSGPAKASGIEKDNPYRVIPEIAEQNYSRISITGNKLDRKMTVEFLGIKGEKLGEWSVMLKDVSVKK